MNLHRHSGVPDWELVPPEEWNEWQQRAAATNGWDTPGNRETAKGIVETSVGLWLISEGHYIVGGLFLASGRNRDLRDGRRADETSTKGPKGEMLDAAADKFLMAEALAVFARQKFISPLETASIGAQNVANAVFTSIATKKGNRPHTPKSGKIATAGYWGGLLTKVSAKVAEHIGYQEAADTLNVIGSVILKSSVAIGLHATRELAHAAFMPAASKEQLSAQIAE